MKKIVYIRPQVKFVYLHDLMQMMMVSEIEIEDEEARRFEDSDTSFTWENDTNVSIW